MGWIPEEQMRHIHIIRQDYAAALADAHASPGDYTAALALEDVIARRARAIRVLREEDGASVRHLASMFRCNKQIIRDAIGERA